MRRDTPRAWTSLVHRHAAGYTAVTGQRSKEARVTIRSWMTRRGTAVALVAVIALVTFAVPAWCVASGTWGW
jgi:uncharacterized YccA/Bax inhibitor family protein